MSNFERRKQETEREVLVDSAIFGFASLTLIVGGVENLTFFIVPPEAELVFGSVLSLASGLRWRDYHLMRDRNRKL
ncbi:MAG TPA: hypothetical protein VLF63_02730 [Patescibacteria group bacterium]|nr:hypothetical protein [Patescibacteria group bacterium]